MFKKVEIWILYLIIIFGILFAIAFGFLVRQELVGGTKLGWISKTALTLAEIPVNIKKILNGPISEFKVEDRFPSINGFDGTPNSIESYLLLSRYDGNLRQGVIELVDLTNFEILHTWNPDIDMFNNILEPKEELKYQVRDRSDSRFVLEHPKLLSDGGLLFHNASPLRKIDACSNLIFQITHDISHHSIEIDADNNIWVPTHIYPSKLPVEKIGSNMIEEGGYYDDGILKLSSDGKVLYEKSVSEIFIENDLEYLLFSVGDLNNFTVDPIHLNDIQPVNYDQAFWKKGDIFLSLRHQSMVILYRPSTNKIIWKTTKNIFHQHDVDIIDDHRIAIFNNNSKDFFRGDTVDGYNEVIIYDFKNDKYTSYMDESMVEHDVRSTTGGRSEIVSNGDLFLEEHNFGRTLYFDSDGSLRWTHVNRANDGNVYMPGWSRISFTEEDVSIIRNFMANKGDCNE